MILEITTCKAKNIGNKSIKVLTSKYHRVRRPTSYMPIEETYVCMFSSAVPLQLVPSTWQAFHDGMACVAARMSAITSPLSSSVRPPDDVLPVFAVAGGNWGCDCAVTLLLLLRGGASRLKE